jgi:hypothetical protein
MESGSSLPQAPERGTEGWISRAARFIHQNEKLLWWLHSGYALLFGLGVMWLGARNFTYIRIAALYIAFIWLTSLFLPVLVNREWISPKWRERIRLTINYFNKNFYQQLLFFLLPIYYASTTFGSRNIIFFLLLTAAAILSTLDIIYDQYLSVRWQLTALFFMFNLFASINVMLPVLWSIGNRWSLWISAILTFGGFASMVYRLSGLQGRRAKLLLTAAGTCLFILIEFLAPLIPPAPLKLVSAEFGADVRAYHVVNPLDRIPVGPTRIVLVTAIQAPRGLKESVRHRWILDGNVLFESRYMEVTGGREDGYRLWTQVTLKEGLSGQNLVVDIETASGQLIGRARLKG